MDPKNIRHSVTFMRMNLTEILIVFLFGITISSAQIKVTARLEDTLNLGNRTGYVELSVDGVNWYKLCVDHFMPSTLTYSKVASVVCKQLGHGPPVLAEGHFRSDSSKEYLQYSNDWCNVNTTEVLDCPLQGSSSTRPGSCIGNIIKVECLPAEAEEYDVALVAGETFHDGVVLIHFNGRWGPICSGSAGDTVCRQLGFGPEEDFPVGNSNTYASPVLNFLYCGSNDETVQECSKLRVILGTCDPDMYVKVYCLISDPTDPPEDDPEGGSRPRGFSTSYLAPFMAIIIAMVIITRVFIVRARAQQRQQNHVGSRGVPSLSSNVNQQRRAPSRFASANYPRQQTLSSTFQGNPPSGTQEAASAPPLYAVTISQSPAVPHPPPNDPDLPSYDDAVRSQRPT